MKLVLPDYLVPNVEPHLPSDIEVIQVDNEGNIQGDGSDAEVYVNAFYPNFSIYDKILAGLPAIKWQQTPSAGVNHLLTPTFLKRDIILTNGAGIHAIPISEFVLTFMLYHAKNVRKLQTLHDEHTWIRGVFLEELADSTLLIIGTGNIGQAIAARAKAFGVRVWGSRRHPDPLPNFDKIVGPDELRSLLPAADYVVIAAALTPETKGLIDETALRSMRQSAYLINIARGAIVDESALVKALREGWIAGAGLDTVATEPLPPENPLWSLSNVFITPHCSALSPRLRERIVNLFIDNLKRYRAGQPLRNVVDKQAGY